MMIGARDVGGQGVQTGNLPPSFPLLNFEYSVAERKPYIQFQCPSDGAGV